MGDEQVVDRAQVMRPAPSWHEALMAEHAAVQSRLRVMIDADDQGEEAV